MSPDALGPWPVRLPPIVAVHSSGSHSLSIQLFLVVVVLFLGGGAADVALLGDHFSIRVLESNFSLLHEVQEIW